LRTDFILKSNIPSKVRKSQEKYEIMHKLNLCLQMFDGVSSESLTKGETFVSHSRIKLPLLSQGVQLQIPFERRGKNKIIYQGG